MAFLPLLCLLALSAAQNACCDLNTLSLSGAGAVSVDPDIAQFTVYATSFGSTSAVALSKVNSLIVQVSTILTSKGIPTANFSTSGINLYPQYNYTDAGVAVLIGQQASISLQVTVGSINLNKQLVGQLVTDISAVNNISLSGISFSNSNTDLAYRQARKAAVSDAVAKANQYSTLSGRALGSIQRIKDQNTEYYTPYYSEYAVYSVRAQVLDVPYGKVQVSANVIIDWNV
jgi:uncharacterized protein YggE